MHAKTGPLVPRLRAADNQVLGETIGIKPCASRDPASWGGELAAVKQRPLRAEETGDPRQTAAQISFALRYLPLLYTVKAVSKTVIEAAISRAPSAPLLRRKGG